MGRLVTALLENAPDVELAGLISEPGSDCTSGEFHPRLPLCGQDRFAESLPPGTILVDFSLAGALEGLLAGAAALRSPLVIGTTGFDSTRISLLQDFARGVPVVMAANFSIGIPALGMLLQLLGRTLPAGFDAEEIETHHRTKIDRPSGTALALAETFREARGGALPPIHSQRLGGVVGEHTWTFSDQEETLILTHRAHSRNAFLRGVLPAVRFVAASQPGYFSLEDVLMAQGGGLEA